MRFISISLMPLARDVADERESLVVVRVFGNTTLLLSFVPPKLSLKYLQVRQTPEVYHKLSAFTQ